MLKKTVFISLFIFWAAVTAILTAGLVFYQKNQSVIPVGSFTNSTSSSGADVVLNMQEVAKHNSPGDCWMVLGDKVYNFTSYIGGHPGGADMILRHCGQDGTVAYQTKDQAQARNHSQGAYNMLADYYIGDLNQKIGNQQAQTNVQTTKNARPSYNSDD